MLIEAVAPRWFTRGALRSGAQHFLSLALHWALLCPIVFGRLYLYIVTLILWSHGPCVAIEKMVYPLLRELRHIGGPERITFGNIRHLYLGSAPWTDAYLSHMLNVVRIDSIREGVRLEEPSVGY